MVTLRRELVERTGGPHPAFAQHLVHTLETTPGGLQQVRGWSTRPAAAALAVRIARRCPLHLVVAFGALELPPPEVGGAALGAESGLFYWLAEDVRALHSPLLVSPADGVAALPLLEGALDRDGVCCVYSRLAKAELLAVLQPLAGAFARPSQLRDQLAAAGAEFVASALEGIEGVLVEEAEPGRWSLFSRGELARDLARVGFLEPDPADA